MSGRRMRWVAFRTRSYRDGFLELKKWFSAS